MKKYLFIDRDGTLIEEPADFQIDRLEKLRLVKDVIPSLIRLQEQGFRFVMVTNQDGLGRVTYPQESFDQVQALMMQILESQGIQFEKVLICPHMPDQNCACRKPKTQLVYDYLSSNDMDRQQSYVIGDRVTDLDLAKNMGLRGFQLGPGTTWKEITHEILMKPRKAAIHRQTSETDIRVEVEIEGQGRNQIHTGIGFLDHMLEQIAKHSGVDFKIQARGDLHIDEHHLVEDLALSLGQALKEALGEKRGIARYGFWLPMDEATAKVSLDLSNRPIFVFKADLKSTEVGGLKAQMVPHFFKSLSDSLGMGLHIEAAGENSHHIVEGIFKAFGKSLGQAVGKVESRPGGASAVPSTKGLL